MTSIINASPSNGITQTADGSGIMKVQSNGVTTNALAWAQFNGTSATVGQSYNISSVTRTSTGNYTVNFTNSLSSTSYSAISNACNPASSANIAATRLTSTVSSFTVNTYTVVGSAADCSDISIVIFGN